MIIKISDEAYWKFIELFNHNKEYNCIVLKPSGGCCKSAKIDIILDDISDINKPMFSYKDLVFSYAEDVISSFSTIEIKYENGTFMVKSTPIPNSATGCSSNCNKKGSCSSCSGCKKSVNEP